MSNALAEETSPYLRQHADNPVDWLPWGPVALARAAERDVPLLVSIGYSSCHWCHVMERESFEDPRTAALMNEEFVCVKVDREERPDVDALYMEAVQSMTGHGGWPLNVFLTPEQIPFYGGTYFPPEPRHGMPAWTQVLQAIAAAWREQADEIRAGGEQVRARLAGGAQLSPSPRPPDPGALDAAVSGLERSFDPLHGGFGDPPTHAPKFPQASVVEFLLARAQPAADSAPRPRPAPGADPPDADLAPDVDAASAALAREMALRSLRAMAAGGIHDQVGGGFHRYAVDATWTVPHFEKMLYDNALLARAYLHGYRLTGEESLREVCQDTLEWALREMRAPEGGFYSALDADSEGGEGSFYVWSLPELHEVLGEDAPAAISWFGATEHGNFRGESGEEVGLNVLEARWPVSDRSEPPPDRSQETLAPEEHPRSGQRRRIRARLLKARERRPRPGLDDKRLTSWNALMIAALADAGAALGGLAEAGATGKASATGEAGARYIEAAERCAEFVLRDLRVPATPPEEGWGRLLRTYSHGRATLDAYLEDHAFLLEALLALFEATCDERWFVQARALADQTIARFADPERGGFFSTASDHEQLIARRKDLQDSPIPSGASSAAMGLLRLAELTGEDEYERHAVGTLALTRELAPRHPTAFGHTLQALHWHAAPTRPIACPIPPTHQALKNR
jgi:uncharacterized protein